MRLLVLFLSLALCPVSRSHTLFLCHASYLFSQLHFFLFFSFLFHWFAFVVTAFGQVNNTQQTTKEIYTRWTNCRWIWGTMYVVLPIVFFSCFSQKATNLLFPHRFVLHLTETKTKCLHNFLPRFSFLFLLLSFCIGYNSMILFSFSLILLILSFAYQPVNSSEYTYLVCIVLSIRLAVYRLRLQILKAPHRLRLSRWLVSTAHSHSAMCERDTTKMKTHSARN